MKPKSNQAISRAACWLWLFLLLRILIGDALAHFPAESRGVTTAATQAERGLYLFTGEQIDPDLGMYYLRARYYQPGIGRFWTMDSFEGRQGEALSLHKYLYCLGNPINLTDPSGYYSQAFGFKAHAAVESEYQAEHPGAIVGPRTGLLGTGLKPDLFNGPEKKFAEIKPLSIGGVASGGAQILAYTAAFKFVDRQFTHDTWPNEVRGIYIDGEQIAFFNVCGVVFYTNKFRNIEELAGITSFAIAREFIRKGVLTSVVNQARALAAIRGTAEGGRLEGMAGIATVISIMGVF